MKKPVLKSIPVGEISIGQPRLRERDEAVVHALKQSIGRLGLEQPILVQAPGKDGRYTLIAGLHRWGAVVKLGAATIDAFVHEVSDDRARDMEIDENLTRADLTALEVAISVADKKRLHQQANPRPGRGGDRRSPEYQSGDSRIDYWADAVAERTGAPKGRIELAATIGERLDPEAAKALRGTRWADNQAALLALCSQKRDGKSGARDYAAQRRAAKLLTDPENPAKTVAEALGVAKRAGGPGSANDPVELALKRLYAAWDAAPGPARARFLKDLCDDGILVRPEGGGRYRLSGE